MNSTCRFYYSKKPYALNLLIMLIGEVLIFYFVLILFGIDFIVLSLVVTLEVMILILFGITPLLTYHEILNDQLVLRVGWIFRGNIPIANIESVERIEKGPIRTGVFFRLNRPELFITSRSYDLIGIKLREKQRFLWALGKKANKIIFDVLDTDALVDLLETHLKSTHASRVQVF
ncbi:MAG: hypothetical protein QHH00_02920 [Methanomassiliicoccales archaeon]|nr:hypothetical protein [Methanomassiliicoccales archaeon]